MHEAAVPRRRTPLLAAAIEAATLQNALVRVAAPDAEHREWIRTAFLSHLADTLSGLAAAPAVPDLLALDDGSLLTPNLARYQLGHIRGARFADAMDLADGPKETIEGAANYEEALLHALAALAPPEWVREVHLEELPLLKGAETAVDVPSLHELANLPERTHPVVVVAPPQEVEATAAAIRRVTHLCVRAYPDGFRPGAAGKRLALQILWSHAHVIVLSPALLSELAQLGVLEFDGPHADAAAILFCASTEDELASVQSAVAAVGAIGCRVAGLLTMPDGHSTAKELCKLVSATVIEVPTAENLHCVTFTPAEGEDPLQAALLALVEAMATTHVGFGRVTLLPDNVAMTRILTASKSLPVPDAAAMISYARFGETRPEPSACVAIFSDRPTATAARRFLVEGARRGAKRLLWLLPPERQEAAVAAVGGVLDFDTREFQLLLSSFVHAESFPALQLGSLQVAHEDTVSALVRLLNDGSSDASPQGVRGRLVYPCAEITGNAQCSWTGAGFSFAISLPPRLCRGRHQMALGPVRATRQHAFAAACYSACRILAAVAQTAESLGEVAKPSSLTVCSRIVPDAFSPDSWEPLRRHLDAAPPVCSATWGKLVGTGMSPRTPVVEAPADLWGHLDQSAEVASKDPTLVAPPDEKVALYVTLVSWGPEAEVYSRQHARAVAALPFYANTRLRMGLGRNVGHNMTSINHLYAFDDAKSFVGSTSAYEPRRSFAVLTREPVHADEFPGVVTWLDGVLACKTRYVTWHRPLVGEPTTGGPAVPTLFSPDEVRQLSAYQNRFWDLLCKTGPHTPREFESARLAHLAQLFPEGAFAAECAADVPPEPQSSMYLVAPMVGRALVPERFLDDGQRHPQYVVTSNELADPENDQRSGSSFELIDFEMDRLREPVVCAWNVDWTQVENVLSERTVGLYDWVLKLRQMVDDALALNSGVSSAVAGAQLAPGSSLCETVGTFDRLWAEMAALESVTEPQLNAEGRDMASDMPPNTARAISALVRGMLVETPRNHARYTLSSFRSRRDASASMIAAGLNDDSSDQSSEMTTSSATSTAKGSKRPASEMDAPDAPTLAEYYELMYGIKLRFPQAGTVDGRQCHYPLCDGAQPVTAKRSVLDPVYVELRDAARKAAAAAEGSEAAPAASTKARSAPRSRNRTGVRLVLELCHVLPVPPDALRLGAMLPSALERLQQLCTANQLRRQLAIPLVTVASLHEALTAPSTEDYFNYERLEMFGDAVLKWLASTALFVGKPSATEGAMTGQRSAMVSNVALARRAKAVGLGNLLNVVHFRASCWAPPGKVADGYIVHLADTPACETDAAAFAAQYRSRYRKQLAAGTHTRELPVRRLADCVEATLGAVALDAGLAAAAEFAERLNIVHMPAIPAAFADGNVPKDTSEALGRGSLATLQERIGYTFARPALAAQAFRHRSGCTLRSHCSERLEFLGDAVLDLLIVRMFFLGSARIDPGRITAMKQLVVSNDAYSRLAVLLGLDEFLVCHDAVRTTVDAYAAEMRRLVASDTSVAELARLSGLYGAPKALGDTLEALSGAILVDVGYDVDRLWEICQPWLQPFVDENAALADDAFSAPVAALHVAVQKLGVPVTELVWDVQVCAGTFSGDAVNGGEYAGTPVAPVAADRRSVRCTVSISGKVVATQLSSTSKTARYAAAIEALAHLRTHPAPAPVPPVPSVPE